MSRAHFLDPLESAGRYSSARARFANINEVPANTISQLVKPNQNNAQASPKKSL